MQAKAGQQANELTDLLWLLRDATWPEFWHVVDQFVDWNRKRDEVERLVQEPGDEPDGSHDKS